MEKEVKKKNYILKSFGDLIWWKKWLFIIVVAVFIGGLIEYLFQLNMVGKVKEGGYRAEIEQISSEDIKTEGAIVQEDGYFMENGGRVIITFPKRYINKLQFYYQASDKYNPDIKKDDLNFQIFIKTRNEFDKEVTEKFEDYSRRNLKFSVVNIQKVVTSIELVVPERTVISDFKVLNEKDFNGYRFLYAVTLVGLFLYLILFSEAITKRIEYGFVIMSLAIGLLIIAVEPPQCMSWDEHIHMYKAFDLFETEKVEWSEAENYLYMYQEDTKKAPFLSKEEKAMQMDYLNNATENVSFYDRGGYSLNHLAYIHMALFIAIGKIFGAPFFILYLLGKIANLLLYSIVIFFAIKTIPIYKKTMAVIALMPTPMVLATAYSYDVTVIAFLFLGTALIIREYLQPEKKIKISSIILILFCFVWGSCPKAAYIPLILSVFFLPSAKFKNGKTAVAIKSVSVLLCLLLLLTYIIPVSSEKVTGDSRGGNTNVSMQLQLILNNPLGYIKILYENLKRTASQYILGYDNLAHMAYAGIHRFYLLITLLVFGVALTEPRKTMRKEVKKGLNIYRMFTLPLIIGIVILIWTALCLMFTEVGSTVIEGVQGRYYLPLFLPFLLIFYSDKIKNEWNDKKYNVVMFLIVLFIWHEALYETFLKTYCS